MKIFFFHFCVIWNLIINKFFLLLLCTREKQERLRLVESGSFVNKNYKRRRQMVWISFINYQRLCPETPIGAIEKGGGSVEIFVFRHKQRQMSLNGKCNFVSNITLCQLCRYVKNYHYLCQIWQAGREGTLSC